MDAIQMGNYGAYVWSCFGLAFVIVLFAEWRARLRHKRVYQEIEIRIKALEERE
ncbi:MAG TPA: heme exporter protein CcmD [Woeseiaceae bacterium]